MSALLEGVASSDLAARPISASDVEACLGLLRGHAAYPDAALPLVARAWRRLLRDEALIGSVVEARHTAGRSAIASVGVSVFVNDDWAAAAIASREPHLALRTIRRELAGRSPILRPDMVADAQGHGLNVLILHYAEAADLPATARPAVRYKTFEAFVDMHRGYRLKAILQEFWDELDTEFVLSGWGRLLNDYADFWARRANDQSAPGRRPYLVGIRRGEALENPGNIAAPLFLYAAPKFGLTRAEQRLLQHALAGSTDIQLALALGIAVPTVKSRWRAIYDRVGRHAPELVPTMSAMGCPRATRGQEKRRRLLAYLRNHPEELRPHAWRD